MPHEPFEIELSEEICTISHVDSLDDLRGPDGRYLAGTVNVTGIVNLYNMKLEQFPVRFGTVGGHFYCGKNRLTSLEGAPGSVGGYFGCHNNLLTSLVGVHRILRRVDGSLHIWGNKIKSGGIGLVLVEGLTKIDADQPAFKIINKYLGQGKVGLLRCQEALHEAGFGEHAQL